MIKDTNERVTVTLNKDQVKKLEHVCEINHLSKSAVIGILISGFLAYNSCNSLHTSFGNLVYGKRDQL